MRVIPQTSDRHPVTRRLAQPRRLLMCKPTYFDVCYSINPWMNPSRPTSTETGLAQWKYLHDLFVELGHDVRLLEPVPGLPDMVFTANGAIVIDDKTMVARFCYPQRHAETAAHEKWLRHNGWPEVRTAHHVNEGSGDFLFTGEEILAATGFRTERAAHEEVAAFFPWPVVSLTLVDPRFYHLDTALSVLDRTEIMFYPQAFNAASRRRLAERFPDAIIATPPDAEAFGLNAFSDGRHVVLPKAATGLAAQLRERGFEPIGVDLQELLKAGGSARCCTLELHRTTDTWPDVARREGDDSDGAA